jgi:putative hydrolase of the HAD superfamily
MYPMPTDSPTARLTGIRAVILDLDDTLYPEQAYAFSGFQAVSDWLRGQMDCPFDPAERMRAIFLTGQRQHVFDRLLAELEHPEARALIPQMLQCYRDHVPQIALHDDARAAIRAWHGCFPLGLISDGTLPVQEKKVQALGLPGLFDEIILTGCWEPAYWKPHARAFELMENRLGIHGPALVYIADNCAKDFVAPRLLGWRTVWIQRPGGVYCDVPPPPGGQPEFHVHSLPQVDLSR